MNESIKKKALERLKNKKYFYPSSKYKLQVQVKDKGRTKKKAKQKKPQNYEGESKSLKRRDSHWQVFRPVRYIELPEDAPRYKTSILDLDSEDDFMDHFEEKFSGLPDGVYTALKGMGRGKGFKHLFMLRIENGEVVRSSWKKKSNGTESANSATYYSLPYYFYTLETLQ